MSNSWKIWMGMKMWSVITCRPQPFSRPSVGGSEGPLHQFLLCAKPMSRNFRPVPEVRFSDHLDSCNHCHRLIGFSVDHDKMVGCRGLLAYGLTPTGIAPVSENSGASQNVLSRI